MTLTSAPPSASAPQPTPAKKRNPLARFFGVRVPLFPMLILIAALAAAVVAGAMNAPTVKWVMSLTSQSTDDQVISSIKRLNKQVLLSLRAEGIKEKEQNGSLVFGVEIPGTSRSMFLRYGFDALLGFEGGALEVTPTGDHAYDVSVPAFTFIGDDNFTSWIAVEKNGALSWITPQIDQLALEHSILTDKAKQQYVADNVEQLRDQAELVLSRIIVSVDPDAKLIFRFAQ